jgi:hypothetical protein
MPFNQLYIILTVSHIARLFHVQTYPHSILGHFVILIGQLRPNRMVNLGDSGFFMLGIMQITRIKSKSLFTYG